MRITAPQGVQLAMNGEDGLLKVEKVRFHTQQGSVAITATGQKTLMELFFVFVPGVLSDYLE